MSLETIAVAVVVAGVIPATLFPILYARGPWRRSFVGRALMTKAIGIALLIDFAVVSHFTPWDTPTAVAVLVYGLVVGGVWLQFLALIVVRYRSRRDPHPKD